MEKKKYPVSKAVIYFIVAFGAAYALQFAARGHSGDAIYTAFLGICMFTPALAVFVSHGSIAKKAGISWKLKKTFKWFLISWLGVILTVSLGTALYFAVRPEHLDLTFSTLTGLPDNTPKEAVIIASIFSAVTFGSIINMVPALGEEIGWRGYMTPMLTEKLGRRKALIIGNIIWSVWHWPAIALCGHNYGFDYFGAPYTGFLVMTVMTVAMGILLSYLYEKSNSILLPGFVHGMFNAAATIPAVFTDNAAADPLLGPAPMGIIAGIPMMILAVIIFFAAKSEKSEETAEGV